MNQNQSMAASDTCITCLGFDHAWHHCYHTCVTCLGLHAYLPCPYNLERYKIPKEMFDAVRLAAVERMKARNDEEQARIRQLEGQRQALESFISETVASTMTPVPGAKRKKLDDGEPEVSQTQESSSDFHERLQKAEESFNEKLDRFKTQAKQQDSKRRDQIRDIMTEKDLVARELERVKADLSTANNKLNQAKSALGEELAKKSQVDVAEEGQVRSETC